jgi:hypothetical protein
MIREMDQPLHATDKIRCSSIREKKISRSFGLSCNTYNKVATGNKVSLSLLV